MQNKSISTPETPSERHSPPILTMQEWARIRAGRASKVEQWAKLPLRQAFADEAWMRGFLSRAGVRIGSDLEPATPDRLRLLLRRAGLTHDQWGAAVGCSLARFLDINPNLPVWAATALVLEASNVFESP